MPSLTVPHRQQLGYGYCLPACLEMVLTYYGIESNQNDLAQRLGLLKNVGVPAPNVLRLASHQLSVRRQPGNLEDLLLALAQGIPPILEVRTGELPYWGEDTYHVVLVTSIDKMNGFNVSQINDPAFPLPQQVPMDELQLAWDERDNYFVTVKRR